MSTTVGQLVNDGTFRIYDEINELGYANSSTDVGISTDGIFYSNEFIEDSTLPSNVPMRFPQSGNMFTDAVTPSYADGGWLMGQNTQEVQYSTNATAPDGTATAATYTSDGSGSNIYIGQNITKTVGVEYEVSVWARVASGTIPTSGNIITVDYRDSNNAALRANSGLTGLSSTWKKFSVRVTTYYSAGSNGAYLIADFNTTATVDIWNAQFKISSAGTAVVKNQFDEMNPIVAESGIFTDLVDLASDLNITGVTTSNFESKGIQSTIEGKNSSFNVFALPGRNGNGTFTAQSLRQGINIGTFSASDFGYFDTTASNGVLSSGNNIELMSGAPHSHLNDKPWMAMALYDCTVTDSFKGILLWIFDNFYSKVGSYDVDVFSTINTCADIFSVNRVDGSTGPVDRVWTCYPHFISPNGTVESPDNYSFTRSQWNFSDGSAIPSRGWYQSSKFSSDDGFWGFIIDGVADANFSPTPAGTNIYTTNLKSYGFGNYDSSDANSSNYGYMLNGQRYLNTASGDYFGMVFTGDA